MTARHVNEQLAAIETAVTTVSDIVAEISATAKEQAVGIDQVGKAVAQVGQVTQQNAANSEESSSAAAELSEQAEQLAAMVGTFQLDRTAIGGTRIRGLDQFPVQCGPTLRLREAAGRGAGPR